MFTLFSSSLLAYLQPLLANADDDAAAGAFIALMGGMMALFCGIGLLGILLAVFNCFYLSSILKRIPIEHRKQEPAMVWLLLIPVFGLIWTFFVYPKIADSFKSYFNAQGRTDVGDCGNSLALALCITLCCAIIPYIGWACASFVAIIIWIILLLKFAGLKKQLPT